MEIKTHPFISLCFLFVSIYQLLSIARIFFISRPRHIFQKIMFTSLICCLLSYIVYEYRIIKLFYLIEQLSNSNYMRFHYSNECFLKSLCVLAATIFVNLIFSFEITDSDQKDVFTYFLIFYNCIRWIAIILIIRKFNTSYFETHLAINVFIAGESVVLAAIFIALFFKIKNIKKTFDLQIVPDSFYYDRLFNQLFWMIAQFVLLLIIEFSIKFLFLVSTLYPITTFISAAHDISNAANVLYYIYMIKLLKNTIFIEHLSIYKEVTLSVVNKHSRYFRFKFNESECISETETNTLEGISAEII